MNAMSNMSNVSWALENIYSDDDRERNEAREIIVDLELAESWEFGEYNDSPESELLFADEIRSRAREAGYGEYLD